MHNVDLILTLTAGLGAALLLGMVALRLRLPPIVGYLVAGLLIGPHTPGFVANRGIAEQLAEVGVILLMFGVGLQFHWKDLMAVKGTAVPGAVLGMATATSVGAVALHWMGLGWGPGLVFGLALSVASTVVLTRVLGENHELQTQAGKIAMGWLVVEDLLTVTALVVLPAVVKQEAQLGMRVLLAVLKVAALGALTLGPGARVIPKVLTLVARTQSRELFTLAVLVVALGIAVASAEVFGVSMALGAFLAGMVVGKSEFSYRAASEALPMRDAFAVLFFVSVGMLFDPQRFLEQPGLAALAFGIVLLAKPLVAVGFVTAMGYGARVGMRVGVSLAQIGEFSFLLAVLGGQLGVLPDGSTDAIVGASIASITLNPLLYRVMPALGKGWARIKPEEIAEDSGKDFAVVVGYGPVGESVCSLLREQGIAPVVIELNLDTVRRLTSEGMKAVYGDAEREEVLREAGVAKAIALVVAVPGTGETMAMIGAARRLNAKVYVVARVAFAAGVERFRKAGADVVVSGEAEVAKAMTEALTTLRRV